MVNVDNGDVGSNANMEYAGTDSSLTLDSGYSNVLLRPLVRASLGIVTAGTKIPTLITDPNYRYPLMTGSAGTAPTFDDARASQYLTLPAVERADTDPSCAAEAAKVDVTAYAFYGDASPQYHLLLQPRHLPVRFWRQECDDHRWDRRSRPSQAGCVLPEVAPTSAAG